MGYYANETVWDQEAWDKTQVKDNRDKRGTKWVFFSLLGVSELTEEQSSW